MTSQFKFNLIKQFLGYNSTADKTNLDPSFLVRGSKNVYKKPSGAIAARPGLKRRGSVDTTTEGVKSSYEWETSTGANRNLRVANSKLQVESDILTSGTYIWYDLLTSLTNTRFIFDTVWDNTVKRDFLVFVRGDSNLFKWSGGMGTIVSTTSNTIVLNAAAATLGFDTSGTVIINGTTYTYTGVSSATLTGVTGDPTGEANGSVAIAGVVTNANTPAAGFNNDFLKVINNQVYVGSYSSRLVYVSSNSSYTNFTVPDPTIEGSPELLTLDNLARGIGVKDGEAYISAGYSEWYRVEFKLINVDTTGLTRQTVVHKQEIVGLGAAMGHEYISNMGDSLVYLTRDKKVREAGKFANLDKTSFPAISLPVETELFNETFTPVQGTTSDGELKCAGNKIYLTSVSGGTTYIYEIRETIGPAGEIMAERFWQPPQIWGISRVALISGVEYGHSLANPQIYQLWDTDQWHDDSPSDEPLPYDCVARISYKGGEDRTDLISVDMVYSEGYMPEGNQLKMKFYGDYQGSTSLQEIIINKTENPTNKAKFFTGFSSPGMGDSSLGDNPLGEGLTDTELSQEQLPKFRKIANLSQVDVFEYELEFYTEDVDSRWELLALGTNAQKSVREPVFIRG